MTGGKPKFAGWYGLPEKDVKRMPHYVVNVLKVPAFLRNEALGVARHAMVMSSARFDPNNGVKYTTYAFRSMFNNVRKFVDGEMARDRRSEIDELDGGELEFVDRRQRDPADIASDRLFAREAILAVQAHDREAVRLTVMEGLTNIEAARALGISSSRVDQMKQRGLKSARLALSKRTA